jgi:hypothetical protein
MAWLPLTRESNFRCWISTIVPIRSRTDVGQHRIASPNFPYYLVIGDEQQHMRGTVAAVDIPDTGIALREAGIAGAGDLHSAVASPFNFHLAGEQHAETIDDVRIPVDETAFPAREAETADAARFAPGVVG